MNLFNPHLIAFLIITLLQILAHSNKGLDLEEKTRLGSMPPSCHNKCNECHPCFAVQVPTVPSHDRVDHRLKHYSTTNPSSLMELYNLPGPGNRYSNYKPLGWNCRCNNHFFNP